MRAEKIIKGNNQRSNTTQSGQKLFTLLPSCTLLRSPAQPVWQIAFSRSHHSAELAAISPHQHIQINGITVQTCFYITNYILCSPPSPSLLYHDITSLVQYPYLCATLHIFILHILHSMCIFFTSTSAIYLSRSIYLCVTKLTRHCRP